MVEKLVTDAVTGLKESLVKIFLITEPVYWHCQTTKTGNKTLEPRQQCQ